MWLNSAVSPDRREIDFNGKFVLCARNYMFRIRIICKILQDFHIRFCLSFKDNKTMLCNAFVFYICILY